MVDLKSIFKLKFRLNFGKILCKKYGVVEGRSEKKLPRFGAYVD